MSDNLRLALGCACGGLLGNAFLHLLPEVAPAVDVGAALRAIRSQRRAAQCPRIRVPAPWLASAGALLLARLVPVRVWRVCFLPPPPPLPPRMQTAGVAASFGPCVATVVPMWTCLQTPACAVASPSPLVQTLRQPLLAFAPC